MKPTITISIILVITALGLIVLFSTGLIVINPGITDNQLLTMNVEKHSELPYTPILILEISEAQINQCMILKTTCQELIDNNQDSHQTQLNQTESNCIIEFLESLSPTMEEIRILWIYYHNFYFKLSFVVS